MSSPASTKKTTKKKGKKVRATTDESPDLSASSSPLSPVPSFNLENKASAASNEIVAQVEEALDALSKALSKKQPVWANCQKLLQQLKILLIEFNLIPPFTGDMAQVKHQLQLARSVHEHAVRLAVKLHDYKAFQVAIAQVKAYYYDYAHLLDASERKPQILGLNLLGLLAHGRMEDFHAELELITFAEREDQIYIAYVVELEQRLTEGNYNKVLRMRKNLPLPEYAFFTDMLAKTVREKISDCCEKGYSSIHLDEAQRLLMLDNRDELDKHTQARGWKISQGCIRFTQQDENVAVSPHSIIMQTLKYATDVERII